jgi:hypothetical protein
MREARADDARSQAGKLTQELFGEARPTAATLLGQTHQVLGPERAARAVELARYAPLTRRSAELASIAALHIGTLDLGPAWWSTARGGKVPPPEEVMATQTAVDPWTDLTVLEMLAAWIADDAADRLWGPPVGVADLNSWQAEDRVEIPAAARPGDRLVVAFDAGGRLDAVVVVRKDDDLGSNLDFNSLRYSRPAEAQWSWGVAAGLGPHPLPGERPDPYGRSVDPEIAAILRQWAVRHGASSQVVGPAWTVCGDVVAAVERADWMWRSAEWFAWWRAVSALIDGDDDQLAARLADLAAGGRA